MSSIKNRLTRAMLATVREAMKTGNPQSLVEYLKSSDDAQVSSRLNKAIHKIERLREFPRGEGMAMMSRVVAEAELDPILKSKLRT